MSERLYHIGNMDCAHCAQEVEQGVALLEGVDSVRVDFASARMVLVGNVDEEALRARVEALGKTLQSSAQAVEAAALHRGRGGLLGFWDYLRERSETRLALLGALGIALTFAAQVLLSLDEGAVALPYTLAMLIALAPIARSGLRVLLVMRSFNINLLMTIAALGAIFIGEHLEGATVIVLFAIGEALEGYTAERARDSLRSLIGLRPRTAWRVRGEAVELTNVEDLALGDVILVKPGEAVPIDGQVISGQSAVNQAPITGESLPVDKSVGSPVYAASINGDSALTVRVTSLAQDSMLARVIRMVEEAQSRKAPSQRLVDQFAQWYTPAVVIVATLLAFGPPLLLSQPFYDTGDERGWLYRALSLLVIACPCSLVISTPVTIISAITAAARRGVLIKGGAFVEALAQLRALAFDKTGTLTHGLPQLTRVAALDCSGAPSCAACDDMLALAAAVEAGSAHPLARAITSAAQARHLDGRYVAEGVMQRVGAGVEGLVDGQRVTVGNHRLFDEEHPHAAELCQQIATREAEGQTAMLVCDGQRVRGYLTVADSVRSDSAEVVRQLNALGLTTVMLTGDNRAVAQAVGQQVGVAEVRAELLPQDKAEAVRQLQTRFGVVGMIGDGVNDAPALALANVGIAMGGAGSAQALEAADVALMADDLRALPFALRLARFARRLIAQNVFISFGLKALFVALAIEGSASLWAAVLADMGVSLLVTLNGVRPLRYT
ncbi:MAG: cation-translocating P-type ATPase [Anaerolineae bacterium]|nr:cation-translocating P-type ATPase [Anaerolineae bacterium]MDW8172778.1 cation-translocating P-type ATPase [Anaerolineae bacterium]